MRVWRLDGTARAKGGCRPSLHRFLDRASLHGLSCASERRQHLVSDPSGRVTDRSLFGPTRRNSGRPTSAPPSCSDSVRSNHAPPQGVEKVEMMRAREHTRSMLQWWWLAGITLADLAVRRWDGTMVWHHEISLDDLPLAWIRAENSRQAEVYIRPARGHSWPVVLLDDLPVATASRIARKYDSLVVRTSVEGGCHLWLRCSDVLDETERRRAQRWLVQRIEADPASVSGEHLGRLAGFKNWKRSGVWVNVLNASRRNRPWAAQFDFSGHERPLPSNEQRIGTVSTDPSPSGREWGWICGLLESGCDATTAYLQLVERARNRRGRDVERYARRTVARACECQPRENHERKVLTQEKRY